MNEDINRQLISVLGSLEKLQRDVKMLILANSKEQGEVPQEMDIAYGSLESFNEHERRR